MNAKAEIKLVDPLESQRQVIRELSAKIDKLNTSIDALQERHESAEPARQELAALEADHEAAMSEWASNGGEGAPPKMDHSKRSKLQSKFETAEAADRANTSAQEKLMQERVNVHQQRKKERAQLRVLALQELVKEAADNAKSYRESLFAAERHRQYVFELRQFIYRSRNEGIPVDMGLVAPLDDALDLNILAGQCDGIVAEAQGKARDHWKQRLDELAAD